MSSGRVREKFVCGVISIGAIVPKTRITFSEAEFVVAAVAFPDNSRESLSTAMLDEDFLIRSEATARAYDDSVLGDSTRITFLGEGGSMHVPARDSHRQLHDLARDETVGHRSVRKFGSAFETRDRQVAPGHWPLLRPSIHVIGRLGITLSPL